MHPATPHAIYELRDHTRTHIHTQTLTGDSIALH